MGAEEAEGQPTLVDMVRRGALKAAHIMAPEAEAGQAQAQAAPEGFRHGNIAGRAVAAPMDGEFLTAHGGASGEDHGFVFALHFFDNVKDGLVIQISVVIVHPHRVGAVVVNHIRGDPFAEVCLEAVHTLGH